MTRFALNCINVMTAAPEKNKPVRYRRYGSYASFSFEMPFLCSGFGVDRIKAVVSTANVTNSVYDCGGRCLIVVVIRIGGWQMTQNTATVRVEVPDLFAVRLK